MNGKKINLNKLIAFNPTCPECGKGIAQSTVIRTDKARNRVRRCSGCSKEYTTSEKVDSTGSIEACNQFKMRILVDDLERAKKEIAGLKALLDSYQPSLSLK